jgi:hypothetical protein
MWPLKQSVTVGRLSLRWLSVLPLGFFLGQVIHYSKISELGQMLWMCNIGNLLLAVGMVLETPLVMRVAAIWMIPGLVVWFLYVAMSWGLFLSSTIAHLGGFLVGVLVLREVRVDRLSWFYALVWYLLLQPISRWLTSPAFNVNVSQQVYGNWARAFDTYWKFWIVMTAVVAVGLWLIGLLLNWLWPPLTPLVAPSDQDLGRRALSGEV